MRYVPIDNSQLYESSFKEAFHFIVGRWVYVALYVAVQEKALWMRSIPIHKHQNKIYLEFRKLSLAFFFSRTVTQL